MKKRKRANYCFFCKEHITKVGKVQRWRGYGVNSKIPVCSFCKWEHGQYTNPEAQYYYLKRKGDRFNILVLLSEKEKPKNCRYKRVCVWLDKDIRNTLTSLGINYDKKYNNYGLGFKKSST